ncbi:MAG TPA: hypothetical protein VGS19_00770 [Streptosporangiaceae bacterium]|nr:hypothetical protein [Streptosporangiaceae bacterium]
MANPDSEALQRIADQCVALVEDQFGQRLDWSVESLTELDCVCEQLLADGPLAAQRLDLWWKLIGAYTGEVLVRAYGGQWVTHDQAAGAYAVSTSGIFAFPFSAAERVLRGEPYKSLASFGRALPAVAEQTQQDD